MYTLRIGIQDLITYIKIYYIEGKTASSLDILNLHAKTMYSVNAIIVFFNDLSVFLDS